MKKLALIGAIAMALAGSAGADPAFYVRANSSPALSSTLDVSWQTAVGTFVEEDLDGFANGADIDTLTMGPIGVDVGLGGLGGTASTAEIFKGSWGTSSGVPVDGTVYGMGLLNRDAVEPQGNVYEEMTFQFSTPVAGFGAWVYDNCQSSAESFEMTVTEVGGATFTSAALESGNGTGHFVEGWLAATSVVGITGVSYRVIDTGTGDPVCRAFELDHLQVSPVPTPAAVLLGMLGLGAAGLKLRKYA